MRGLPNKHRAKVLASVALLEEEGNRPGRPFAAHLEDGIYELRIRVSTIRYRILYYFWKRGTIVLTHGFVKKGALVPAREIERAKRFKGEWWADHGGGDQ